VVSFVCRALVRCFLGSLTVDSFGVQVPHRVVLKCTLALLFGMLVSSLEETLGIVGLAMPWLDATKNPCV
jgi:hypothetical protein